MQGTIVRLAVILGLNHLQRMCWSDLHCLFVCSAPAAAQLAHTIALGFRVQDLHLSPIDATCEHRAGHAPSCITSLEYTAAVDLAYTTLPRVLSAASSSEPVKWCPGAETLTYLTLCAQDLMAGLLVMETLIPSARLKPWWRLWAFPLPHPASSGNVWEPTPAHP